MRNKYAIQQREEIIMIQYEINFILFSWIKSIDIE